MESHYNNLKQGHQVTEHGTDSDATFSLKVLTLSNASFKTKLHASKIYVRALYDDESIITSFPVVNEDN